MAAEIPLPDLKENAESPPVLPAAERAAREDDEISLLDILIALAERKHIVLWVTVTFAILAAIISLLLPKSYTATVTLLPPQQGSSMGAALWLPSLIT